MGVSIPKCRYSRSDILKLCHRSTDLPEMPEFWSNGLGTTSQSNFMTVITAMDVLHEEMSEKLYEDHSPTDCSSVDLSRMASMPIPVVTDPRIPVTDVSLPTFADEYYFDTRPRQQILKSSGDPLLSDLADATRQLGIMLSRIDKVDKMSVVEFEQYMWETKGLDSEDEFMFMQEYHEDLSDEEATGTAREFDLSTPGGRRRAWRRERDLRSSHDKLPKYPA